MWKIGVISTTCLSLRIGHSPPSHPLPPHYPPSHHLLIHSFLPQTSRLARFRTDYLRCTAHPLGSWYSTSCWRTATPDPRGTRTAAPCGDTVALLVDVLNYLLTYRDRRTHQIISQLIRTDKLTAKISPDYPYYHGIYLKTNPPISHMPQRFKLSPDSNMGSWEIVGILV